MRAFFCLELEEQVKEELARITQELKRRSVARVNWVVKENLHITLRFLGEIDAGLVPALQAAAELALDGITGFELQLDRLGAFPELDRARVIWIGSSSPPQQITQLYRALELQLEELGFAPEGKPYTPHITLGRVKERDRAKRTALAERLRAVAPFVFRTKTRVLTLMESRLTPGGAIYRPVFRLEF